MLQYAVVQAHTFRKESLPHVNSVRLGHTVLMEAVNHALNAHNVHQATTFTLHAIYLLTLYVLNA